MSRTKRHIPLWARERLLGKDWMHSRVMLGDYLRHPYFISSREHIYFGHDNRHSRSYLYTSYPTKGWPEVYGKTARKFFKRCFHKQRRLIEKRYDWMNEY